MYKRYHLIKVRYECVSGHNVRGLNFRTPIVLKKEKNHIFQLSVNIDIKLYFNLSINDAYYLFSITQLTYIYLKIVLIS